MCSSDLLVREVQVAAIGLRFARERVAQTLFGFRSLQTHDDLLGQVMETACASASELASRNASRAARQYTASIRCIVGGYSALTGHEGDGPARPFAKLRAAVGG